MAAMLVVARLRIEPQVASIVVNVPRMDGQPARYELTHLRLLARRGLQRKVLQLLREHEGATRGR